MPERNLHILGLNPGTKYTGWTVFSGPELRDWGIKTLKGKWSKAKVRKVKELIAALIDRYGINLMAVKRVHPSRSSRQLNFLIKEIVNFCRRKKIKIMAYSLPELETFFSEGREKINRKDLAELLAREYPPLCHLLEKEGRNKNPYHLRLFEAVALGAACHFQNEKIILK